MEVFRVIALSRFGVICGILQEAGEGMPIERASHTSHG